MITVYTLPTCPQCVQTKSYLKERGAEYLEVDLTKSPAALALIKDRGFRSAPVVKVGEEMWSGYKPEKLASVLM